VLIEDGLVAAVEPRLEVGDAEILDAADCVVAPGFLDIHVHLREPGIEHAETIETGARAAAAGGFTSICCMPNTIPVNDSPTVTNFIVERARRYAPVNVFPIGAITKDSAGEQLAEIGAMKAAGIVAISDDGQPVMNSQVMRRAMQYAASFGLTVIDHCEDLNPNRGAEIGKIRPVLVLQDDALSGEVTRTVVVLPLTAQVRPGLRRLRITIAARDRLLKDCQILVDQPRTLDRRRLADGPLTTLTAEEMAAVERGLLAVLGIN
jgi:dihydroorotase-like cyclic amidohydrolase